jgi:predicted CXXCH cytochrome family protein
VLAAVGLVIAAMTAWIWWPIRGPGTAPAPDGTPPVILEPDHVVFGRYAGSESCRECHGEAFRSWNDSHHQLAERLPDEALDRAAFVPGRDFRHGTQETAVGVHDGHFTIAAPGLNGQRDRLPVARVIGHDPLRQYLLPASGGRWQTSEAAWDPHRNEWFNVYGSEDRQPGEWGHWTGRGMNWNSMCATCHNTRFRKNYNAASDSYRSAMAEPTVGCEACHGPMRDHVLWQRAWAGSGRKDPSLIPVSRTQHMENCAPCHSRRSELTGDFVPGGAFWDHFLLAIVDGRDVFHPDGQVREEDYEYAPFLGSRMHAAGVTCIDCHDPHSGKLKLGGNDLCMQCHNGSRPGSPVIVAETHTFHLPGSEGSLCVKCHMPQTVFMQRDGRHDHGFTTPDPLLTQEFGIPNACNRCHGDQDARWALDACEKWYGKRMERPARQRTRALAAARRGDATAVQPLLALLESPETPYWRASAIAMLSPWAREDRVKDSIARQLTDPHPLVRYHAVQALEPFVEAGEAPIIEAIRPRLNDDTRAVRITAAWALRHDSPPESRAGHDLAHMLAINADQPTGQAQLGASAMARGQQGLAVEHYARAVQWDPGSPPLRHDYAVALSRVGAAEEALRQTQAAVRLEPGVAENHYRLGLAWNEVGNLAQAIAALEEATRLDGAHDRALYNLGLAYQATGNSEAALGTLHRAEAANPTDPRIPYARATVLVQTGRPEEAMAAIERVLALDATFGPAQALREVLMR